MSSDPFAAPHHAASAPGSGLSNEGWLSVAFALLLVPAVLSGSLAALTGGVGIVGLFVDVPMEPGDPPLAVMGLLECAFFLIPTTLYSAAATGVFVRARWGWVMGLVGFALWMGGCCAPLGLVGFYALLRDDARKSFGF